MSSSQTTLFGLCSHPRKYNRISFVVTHFWLASHWCRIKSMYLSSWVLQGTDSYHQFSDASWHLALSDLQQVNKVMWRVLTGCCWYRSLPVLTSLACCNPHFWHYLLYIFFQFCTGRPSELSAMRFNSAIFLALPAGCLFWSVEQRKCCQVESGNKWQWGNWKVIKKTILLERVTLFPKGFAKAIQLDTSRKRLDYANFLAGCRHVADLSLTLQTSRLSWGSSLFYVRTCPHLLFLLLKFFNFSCFRNLFDLPLAFFLFNMTA